MKVHNAEFILSAVNEAQLPADGRPEVAFAGRSNVGKSSLINTLTSRKHLAKTSNTPGKTRQLNCYLINNEFYFIDLPGYGYAKVSKAEREQWGQFIEEYLLERESLLGVIQIVDSRRPPSPDDKTMFEWFMYNQMPTIVVASKADKIPKSKRGKSIKEIRQAFMMEALQPVVLFSSATGEGKEELWGYISDMVVSEQSG